VTHGTKFLSLLILLRITQRLTPAASMLSTVDSSIASRPPTCSLIQSWSSGSSSLPRSCSPSCSSSSRSSSSRRFAEVTPLSKERNGEEGEVYVRGGGQSDCPWSGAALPLVGRALPLVGAADCPWSALASRAVRLPLVHCRLGTSAGRSIHLRPCSSGHRPNAVASGAGMVSWYVVGVAAGSAGSTAPGGPGDEPELVQPSKGRLHRSLTPTQITGQPSSPRVRVGPVTVGVPSQSQSGGEVVRLGYPPANVTFPVLPRTIQPTHIRVGHSRRWQPERVGAGHRADSRSAHHGRSDHGRP